MSIVATRSESVRSALRRPGAAHPWLTLGAWIVAVCVLAPLLFLGLAATQAGWSSVSRVFLRQLTVTLMVNTVAMTLLVTIVAAFIGITAAWILERTDVPARRTLLVVLIIPAAIPDFIETFGWINVAPWLHGLLGAVFVLSLAVYPFVMVPVAAALRRVDHRHEEVASSLGVSRVGVITRVTLPAVRTAIAGGCLLVALQLLAEYGSFEMLGYRTFTTEIFTEFQVGLNIEIAAALCIVLVIMSAMLVLGESAVSAAGRRESGSDVVTAPRIELRHLTPVALAFLVLVATGAFLIPAGSIVSLLLNPGPAILPGASLVAAVGSSLLYGLAAATLATLGAAVIALGSQRARTTLRRAPSTLALVPLAVPGVVVALALSYVAEHYGGGRFYESSALLIAGYTVMFLPLALIGVRSSLDQVPESLLEVAASLGSTRSAQLVRVVVPLIAPGLGAGFALVFLSTITELTATLVMIPTGIETLATQFWTYQTNVSYGQAAPYAAAMILLAAPPLVLLARLGERRGDRRR